MQNYEKPEVILMTECSEDSRYMKGAWKKPDYSNSNVQMRA